MGVTDPAGNDPESLMWMYYLAQITLRKLLNRVHSELYKESMYSVLAVAHLLIRVSKKRQRFKTCGMVD